MAEVVLLPDWELEELARENGAGSVEAMVLASVPSTGRYAR